MMHHFHQNQQPNPSICAPKSFYMDRLGNLSTSSGGSTSSSSGNGSAGMAPARKQILSLKPKNPPAGPQIQEGKDTAPPSTAAPVPVTKLALKKDKKVEKNVVTQLTYRKPNSVTSSGGSTSSASTTSSSADYHMMMSMMMNGGAFHPDTIMDDSVFSSLLSSYAYNNNQHDMLHSHPIWSPQMVPNQMMMSPDAINYLIEKENQFLVQ